MAWLPDVGAWVRVVAQFPRPGGNLYFADLHPIAAVFDGLGDAADMPAGG